MTKSKGCCPIELAAGVLLMSMAALAYEIVLTRILGVTLGLQVGLLAVSIALFGLTGGAMLVYGLPGFFAPDRAAHRMALAAAGFAVLTPVSFAIYLRCWGARTFVVLDVLGSWEGLAALAGPCVVLALPLLAAGVYLTVALAQHPQQAGGLYAANLAGDALGCLAVATLSARIDAPVLLLDVAVLGAMVAGHGMVRIDRRHLLWIGPAALVGGILVGAANLVWATDAFPFISVFGLQEHGKRPRLLFERWNAFSWVTVCDAGKTPLGWGLSSRFKSPGPLRQLRLGVDASSSMLMTEFHGDLATVDHLRYDVVHLVHYLRPNARVLVLGSGGDRDVLAALAFRQREIVGVEVNDLVLAATHDEFGEFTGHLDHRPNVRFIHDEGRRYLARNRQTFDIIQASVLDSWAVLPGGANLLAENSLYTVEAWQRMFQRLSGRGLVSFSRWYADRGPGEIYRLAVVARIALERLGIHDPRRHFLVVCHNAGNTKGHVAGMATLLASREPLSDEDVATATRVAGELGFEVLCSPRAASDARLAALIDAPDLDAFTRDFPIDISPSTDDRPFFFGMVRWRDVRSLWTSAGPDRPDQQLEVETEAIAFVVIVTAAAFGLGAIGVLVPLGLSRRRRRPAGALRWGLYFAAIGLGFMFVEIALIQRLNLVLGSPTCALTVVLFCLLLSGGAGSWLSTPLMPDASGWRPRMCLAVLTAGIFLAALVVLPWFSALDDASPAASIAAAAGLLAPLGLLMGMPFPLGLRAAARDADAPTAWFYGTAGAGSICGSVGAVVLSLGFGITVTMLVGAGCYLAAIMAFAPGRQSALP